jgi:predicted phosphodiesterase
MKNQKFNRHFVGILIFGCTFLGSLPEANAQITKGPYLIYSGVNTQMTVLWQTDREENCRIAWGFDKTYSNGNASSFEYATDHQHEFTIKGLVPGSKYYYHVIVGQDTYSGSFRAAPPSNATSVEFLAYGDTRSNPDRQDKVCRGVISAFTEDPACQSFILHTGDWVSGNSEKDWANEFFNRSYKNNITMQANLPIEGCRGNHEGKATVFSEYWPYPFVDDGKYWSFDYGPAHIAIVDEYTNLGRGSAQLEWLAQDLRNCTKKWKFILLHEPGWSASGFFKSPNKDVQAYIEPLCEKYGVQIVFGGHNHYYARAVVHGVHHLTLGTGGAPFHQPKAGQPNIVAYQRDILGFCRISISGDVLNYEMLSSPDNRVIDSFTIVRQ